MIVNPFLMVKKVRLKKYLDTVSEILTGDFQPY
jgi:hypothetical protein